MFFFVLNSCRTLLGRPQCELNIIKTLGKIVLEKFYYHNLYAVHSSSVTIFGAQFSVNSTFALVVELFHHLPFHPQVQDFFITPNGHHMFATFKRKYWELQSILRYGEICHSLDLNPSVRHPSLQNFPLFLCCFYSFPFLFNHFYYRIHFFFHISSYVLLNYRESWMLVCLVIMFPCVSLGSIALLLMKTYFTLSLEDIIRLSQESCNNATLVIFVSMD